MDTKEQENQPYSDKQYQNILSHNFNKLQKKSKI